MLDLFKDFFKYLLFRDMCSMGDGYLTSVVCWVFLILCVVLVLRSF